MSMDQENDLIPAQSAENTTVPAAAEEPKAATPKRRGRPPKQKTEPAPERNVVPSAQSPTPAEVVPAPEKKEVSSGIPAESKEKRHRATVKIPRKAI